MEKIKYKSETNKSSKKKILILLFVMLIILMILSAILNYLTSSNEKDKELTYDNLTSVKEVIEYYKSTYITENESKEENFYLDVYLKFKELPYDENNNSNEEYYNNLLEDSAKVLYYRSFRMIDNENDLTVEVICSNSKISSIKINGIEDYFIYMDSQISLEKYKEIPITDLEISSEILRQCIDNNWSKDIYLGERDSIFKNYYIYFDEGIKAKIIGDSIYNIIFDKNYKNNVVNGISPGTDFNYIEATFGKATFEAEKIIGYKGDNIYVFFTDNEISIYKNIKTSADDFFDLADKFLDEELDFLEFMNELTYMWPDYNDYNYSSDYVFISYPLKGIEIKLNYDDLSGIILYNNIKSSLSKASRYLESTNFVARLQLDSVFEAEKRRVDEENTLLSKSDEYIESLDDEKKKLIGQSLDYAILPEFDNTNYITSMYFISKFNDGPNRELNDSINDYMWLTSKYFLYSKVNKGIYLYSLETGIVKRLVTGSETYKLKEYKDGILKYDDEELKINLDI